jgi:large subunit ribosomal protein L25
MSDATIEVERREETGKGAARRLRSRNMIPAVLYGAGRDSVAIQIPRKMLIDLFKEGGHENRIFLLHLAGTEKSRHAMIRDLQIDPMNHEVRHLDFQRISMDEKLRVKVHVVLEGEAHGVRNGGGVLDFVTRELEIECLPTAIPSEIRFDVSELAVGQHLDVDAIELPEGVEYVGSSGTVIASVKHARVEAVEVEEEEGELEAVAEGEEPEVIQRGKKDDEEAEAES